MHVFVHLLELTTNMEIQGIKGDFKLSGSTPELDDFVIRIVDGESSFTPYIARC